MELLSVVAGGGFVIVALLVLVYLFTPWLDVLKVRFVKMREKRGEKVGEVYGERDAAEVREKFALEDGKKEAEEYRKKLLEMGDFTNITQVVSDKQLPLSETYIKLKIHEKQESFFKEPEQNLHVLAFNPNEQYKLDQTRLLERTTRAIEPAEALKQHRLAVFIGDPGAGKTTTLRYLALISAMGELKKYDLPDLPIFLPISKLTGSKEDDLVKFLPAFVQREYGLDNCAVFLEKQLELGKVLVMLDGLDEAGALNREDNENLYRNTIDMIMRFHRRYTKTPIIVTCRKAGWAGGLEGFKVLEVLDLSWEDVKNYIHSWICPTSLPLDQLELAKQHEAKLISDLEKNVRIRFLAANPLLLSLICSVFDADGELPERRTLLYEECVRWLLSKWDKYRDLDRRNKFPAARKLDLLRELALYFQQKRHRYFEKTEVITRISDFLPQINLSNEQPDNVLDEIMRNQGLIKEDGVEWYGFPHLTLQEFFCASALRKKNNIQPMIDHLGDSWWEEVTLLYAGDADAASLLEAILNQEDDIFYTNLLLATRCLTGSPLITKPEIRSILLENCLKICMDEVQQPPYIRDQVLSALIECGDLEIRDRLFHELIVNYSQINIVLLQKLFPVLKMEQTYKLISLFKNPKISLEKKWELAISVGLFKEKNVIPQLLQILEDPKQSDELRSIVATCLSMFRENSINSKLLQLLKDPKENIKTRAIIATSLGLNGEKNITTELLNLFEDSKFNNNLKQGVAVGLSFSADGVVISQLLRDPTLTDSIKINMLSNVGILGEKSMAIELLQLFESPKLTNNLKKSIVLALRRIANTSIVPNLLEMLKDQKLDNSIKKEIVISLGELGDKNVVPQLLLLFQGPKLNNNVKKSIATVLGSIGDKSIIPTLLGMLEDPKLNNSIRREIVISLGELGDKTVVPQLLLLFEDPKLSDIVKQRIVTSLGTLGDTSITMEMLKSFANPTLSDPVKQSIVNNLKNLVNTEEQLLILANFVVQNKVVYGYKPLHDTAQRMRHRVFVDNSTTPPRVILRPLPK